MRNTTVVRVLVLSLHLCRMELVVGVSRREAKRQIGPVTYASHIWLFSSLSPRESPITTSAGYIEITALPRGGST